MLQNKISFNQSSVSLEIIGLPDYSNNENIDNISIISQWKLMIIDKPVIEGNIDHLSSVMKAFYSYSISFLHDEIALYESSFIDIKPQNYYTHILHLKSSKPEVKPLNIKIGNSTLADIISCFDQLTSSSQVKKISSSEFKRLKKKKKTNLLDKKNISNLLLPPLVSLFSIFLVSTAFIYFYDGNDSDSNRSLLKNKNKLISIESINKLL